MSQNPQMESAQKKARLQKIKLQNISQAAAEVQA
ncbi:hypothetical protein DESA109040_16390 [Deinococcus saxicola]